MRDVFADSEKIYVVTRAGAVLCVHCSLAKYTNPSVGQLEKK